MSVHISQEEMQIFNNNGISEEQIRNTVNLYRNDGLSDNEIRAKVDIKLNSFKNQTTAQSVNNNQTKSEEITQNQDNTKSTVLTGGVSQNYTQNWDSKGRIYYTDENGNKVDFKVNPIKKIGNKIKAAAFNANRWLNETNPNSEAYKQKVNAILTLETLPLGVGKAATQWGVNKLTPFLGKKIAQGVAEGVGSGLVGGGVFGAGNAMIEGENPLVGALEGAGGGLVGGAALSGIGGQIVKGVRARKLRKSKTNDLSKEEIKKLRDDARSFYNDYIKGTSVTRDDLGKIHFGDAGIGEQLSKGLHNANIIPDLKKQIKTGKKQPIPRKDYPRDDIKHFHIIDNKINNKNIEYQIAEDANGNKYYFAKDITKNEDLPPTNQNQNLGSEINPTNIMTDNAENFNPNITKSKNIKTKQSQLAQNADLPEDMQKTIKIDNPEYEVLHNDSLIANAQKAISKDANGRRVRLEDLADKEQPLTAQDFEEARQLVGQLYKEGRIDEAIKLTEKISVAGSRAGQSVQAMSLWAKTTPEGAVRQAQKIIDNYNKTARKKIPKLTEEQANTIIGMAEDIQKLNGETVKGNVFIGSREQDVATAKLMKYLGELVPQSVGNKLKTLRNISLLLNGKTFARNITGNAIFSGMENAVTKPIAAGLDKLASKFTGKRTRVMPQLKNYVQGLKQGYIEGKEDVNLGIDTRKGIGQRFDLPQRRSFDDPFFGGLEKALDFSLRVPDRAFYQATFNESLVNQLKAAGTDKITEKMLSIANQEALESVYQNNGQIASMVSGVRKGLNQAGIKDFGLGDALIPYAQTPANVAQQGINYSPLGIVNAIKSGLQGNQRQATLDAARAITGTGIIGAGYGLSKVGNIMPEVEDYQTRKNYEALGIRPNQIILPNGSVMSYSQLQPLAAPLATGAILNDVKGGNYMQAMDKGIGTLADLSMLRGITDFIKNYNNNGIASAITNTITSIPSQFIGTGINQINTYIDPYQRETYSPNPIIQGLNQARAKTPFLSKTLPKKYDVAGREIEKYEDKNFVSKAFDNFLNPVFVNKPKDDLVLQEVTALYEVTGEKGGLLDVPEKKIKLDDGTTKQLNGKEFSEYSKLLGEASYRGYEKIMNTQRYLNADYSTRLKLLGDVKQKTKANVQEELFGKTNKHSIENAIKRKVQNRLNKGQNKLDRIFSKIDSKLVDDIMYKE